MAVPRFIWNSLLAAISLALAWGGRENLIGVINNFLSLLGYWTICFGVVLAIETFWFRPRNGGYDLEGWQDQDRMPLGIAACVSLALGPWCQLSGYESDLGKCLIPWPLLR